MAKTTKKTTAKKTPLQLMKDKFGAKKDLVAALVDKLERREEESKADFEKRLLKVSAKKLLSLMDRAETAAKAGGRLAMTDAIHDFVQKARTKKGTPKVDTNMKKQLAKETLGTIVDTYKTVQKKLRKAAPKA